MTSWNNFKMLRRDGFYIFWRNTEASSGLWIRSPLTASSFTAGICSCIFNLPRFQRIITEKAKHEMIWWSAFFIKTHCFTVLLPNLGDQTHSLQLTCLQGTCMVWCGWTIERVRNIKAELDNIQWKVSFLKDPSGLEKAISAQRIFTVDLQGNWQGVWSHSEAMPSKQGTRFQTFHPPNQQE